MDAPRTSAAQCRRPAQRAIPARLPADLRFPPPRIVAVRSAEVSKAPAWRFHEPSSCVCCRDRRDWRVSVRAGTGTSSRRPTLTPLWDLKGDFAAPESAYYDAASNSVFVSSINGQILEKDGNGYISRLSPDGKMVSAKWVTGLNAPKGLRSAGNTLWVSDIDEIVCNRHRRRRRSRAHQGGVDGAAPRRSS